MEQWKAVPRYEGYYEVSSLGTVRRVKAASGTVVGKVIKPQIRSNGYYTVSLWVRSKGYCECVHRLVSEAFFGARPDGYEVNHKDGNKLNNSVDNLEYVTPSQNRKHAVDTGLLVVLPDRRARGERIGNSKLKSKDVEAIKQRLAKKESGQKIADDYGITRTTVSYIRLGKIWKHLNSEVRNASN